MKKIAIMTAGGDCAGLNSAIKAIVMTANTHGIETIGVTDGYIGFVEGNYIPLTVDTVRNIEIQGGTMLGSSNKECPFHYYNKKTGGFDDRTDEGIKKLRAQGVEGMVVVGGDGTLDSARVIFEHGMPTVGIPKTIDNDMSASEPTIGFQTAIEAAVEAIRRLITTAYSHRRVMVVELMGRTSGYLTLYAGFAAGADIILLPEHDYNLKAVCNRVDEIMKSGKRYVIIAISEAAKEEGGEETIAKLVKDSFEQKRYGGVSQKLAAQIEQLTGYETRAGGVSQKLAAQIEQLTGYETRATVLGHIQRGGEPTTQDIILGAQLGNAAAKLLIEGNPGYIVGMKGGKVQKVEFPKDRVPRLLDFEKDDLCKTARDMGIFLGVEE